MVADKVATELRSALDTMKAERAELDEKIQLLEQMLTKFGVKRGPGRPPGSANKKRGPGRPPGSKNNPKRGPGRPPAEKKPAKAKVKRNWSPAARKAAAERMRQIWAERAKKNKSGSKTKK